MDIRGLITVFITIFLAELGDKTQIATLLFSTDKQADKLSIFLGASIALICTSLIGVLFGTALSNFINPKYLGIASGIIFIIIGIYTVIASVRPIL